MPNHCDNDLTVAGAVEDVQEFEKFAAGGEDTATETQPIDFNKFIPYPAKFGEQDERAAAAKKIPGAEYVNDGFNSGGYEWCIANWGTKWNAYSQSVDAPEDWEGERELCYHFETAWAPPEPIIRAMAERFDKLSFTLRYFERGAAYNGILQIEKGEVTAQDQGSYYGTRGG